MRKVVKEVMKNKREFNKRKNELSEEGYAKCKEFHNRQGFRKPISYDAEIIVELVQGWKSDNQGQENILI